MKWNTVFSPVKYLFMCQKRMLSWLYCHIKNESSTHPISKQNDSSFRDMITVPFYELYPALFLLPDCTQYCIKAFDGSA